jgi:hypothetical protein
VGATSGLDAVENVSADNRTLHSPSATSTELSGLRTMSLIEVSV